MVPLILRVAQQYTYWITLDQYRQTTNNSLKDSRFIMGPTVDIYAKLVVSDRNAAPILAPKVQRSTHFDTIVKGVEEASGHVSCRPVESALFQKLEPGSRRHLGYGPFQIERTIDGAVGIWAICRSHDSCARCLCGERLGWRRLSRRGCLKRRTRNREDG